MNDRNSVVKEKKSVFIQRDYTNGLTVKWCADFPTELVGIIDEKTWGNFIRELNEAYYVADKVTRRSVMETMLGILTCYLIRPCMRSIYDVQLEDIADYIDEMNDRHFQPRGVFVHNPMEHGMRVMEVTFLCLSKEKSINNFVPSPNNQPRLIPRA